MKAIFHILSVIFLSSLLPGNIFAQNKASNSNIVEILVNDLENAETKVKKYVEDNKITFSKYNRSEYYLEIQLFIDSAAAEKLSTEYKTWGYISSENILKSTYQLDIDKLNNDIAQLQKEKATYQFMTKYSDSTAKSSLGYIEKTIEIDKSIYQSELKLKELIKSNNVTYMQIKLTEEKNSTMEYSSSWVNMPGLEYSALWIEQPNPGKTPQMMQGISLKYMFNTGKSYGVLGLYKNFGESTEADQMFTFAFGQDFYSRRMGRGQRKFFNLYTSLNGGVYVLNGNDQRSSSWFINPYLGLEIFKNKYFLIDNKVGYFLPYRDNRNMRGLLYNFSFNFVF